jgi:uncharacterized membrane protein YhhN
MKRVSLLLFFLVVAGELISQVTGTDWLHQLCKPLIMIFLGLYYYLGVTRENRSWLVMLAILFSFLGDTFLMYEEVNEMYFMLGLGGFLAAHVFYLFTYHEHSDRTDNGGSQVNRVRLAFPVILAGTGLIAILYPVLGDLQLPVIVYALVLMAMVITAIYRLGRTSFESFILVLFGAFLFMISDSLLAINKFLDEIPFAGLWIMLTYIGAQFMIIAGLMKHSRRAI